MECKKRCFLYFKVLAIILFISVTFFLGVCVNSVAQSNSFIKRNGAILYDDINNNNIQDSNEPDFRWVSFNMSGTVYKDWGTGKYIPDSWELEQQFKTINLMGGQVTRLYTITVGPDVGYYTPMVTGPGMYTEKSLRHLDKVLQLANQYNVRVIIPFVDNYEYPVYGGIANWAGFRGKSKGDFYSDGQVKQDFKNFITYLLNRTNYYTGVKYKDDKAILAWETGNELSPPASWTSEIAAHIKSVDSNHLVMDGRYGVDHQSLYNNNIDIVSDHYYGRSPITNQGQGIKPFYVGEIGSSDGADNTSWLRDRINEAINNGICGIDIWKLVQPTKGAGIGHYNGHDRLSYAWPGNAASRYDEQGTLNMLREKAYLLKGENPPPIPVPEAPVLPEINTVHSFSWIQGFGSETYVLERAESINGPWEIIGENLRNDITPYKPYNDRLAVAGTSYYYRIKGVNVAGESPYSNIAGPVTADNEITVAKEWSFYNNLAGTSEGFSSDSGTVGFTADEGGMLRFAVINSNPSILSPDSLNINIDYSKKIRITMRNGTISDTGRIMFTTTSDNEWSDAKSKNFSINVSDDLFTTYTIDMSDVQEWNGTLKRLKIIPEIGVSTGDIGIQSIKIIQTHHSGQEITITDDLSDWSKTYSHTDNLWFDNNNTQYFEKDASRAARTGSSTSEIVWHRNDIKRFEAIGYFWTYEGVEHLTFYTSNDGQNWNFVNPVITGGTGDWKKYIYTLNNLVNVNYVKVSINGLSGGETWNPQLSKVNITYSTPGEAIIIDELNDWGKTYKHSVNLSFDGNNTNYFNGDTSRIFRNQYYIPVEEVIWYHKDINYFEAEGYYWPYEDIHHFTFYISDDGVNWQEVIPNISIGNVEWSKYTYTLSSLQNVDYVKVRWYYNWPGGEHFNQQLSKVKIKYLLP